MKLRPEAAFSVALALMLVGCGSVDGASDSATNRPATGSAPAPAGPLVSDSPVKIGDPFTIEGITHTPRDVIDYDDVGYASWYGQEFAGRATANGEAFNPAAFSGAHKTLPLPSYVEVTALDSGRTILVRVNDRGPMDNRRLIDLSEAAAKQLGIADKPTAVRVRRVNPPLSEREQLRAGLSVPDRLETPESLLKILRAKATALPPATNVPAVAVTAPKPLPATKAPDPANAAPVAKPALKPKPVATAKPAAKPVAAGDYIVQVAAFSTKARADAAATKVGGSVSAAGNLWRVRIGPFADEAAAKNALAKAKAEGFGDARVMRDK
jgi:rare lipoprotein A